MEKATESTVDKFPGGYCFQVVQNGNPVLAWPVDEKYLNMVIDVCQKIKKNPKKNEAGERLIGIVSVVMPDAPKPAAVPKGPTAYELLKGNTDGEPKQGPGGI